MAQHSNYAKDRDLMMEAYASVQGEVPKTSSTALPRGYVLQESSCNSEHEEHSHEDNEQEKQGENLFSSFASDQGDDFFEALEDVLKVTGTSDYDAVVAGMKVKLGKKELSPRQLEEIENVIQNDELPEDAETEANATFDHSVVFQLEGPLSMGVTPLERDVDEASAGLADRKEKEELNGMLLVSDEDGKCILFYNGEELDQDGLEAAVKSFHGAEHEEHKAEDGE